jgi:hypothetical protein
VTQLVDPSLGGSFPEGDGLRCIHIGLLCVQGDPVTRPVMSSVVMMLGSDTFSLQSPGPTTRQHSRIDSVSEGLATHGSPEIFSVGRII